MNQILTDEEINAIVSKSKLAAKYNQVIDSESAYEILGAKIEQAQQQQAEQIAQELQEKEQAKLEKEQAKAEKTTKAGKSTLDKMLNNTVTRQLARTATREVTRGLLGVLKGMFK